MLKQEPQSHSYQRHGQQQGHEYQHANGPCFDSIKEKAFSIHKLGFYGFG
jgi:hypothetical protein